MTVDDPAVYLNGDKNRLNNWNSLFIIPIWRNSDRLRIHYLRLGVFYLRIHSLRYNNRSCYYRSRGNIAWRCDCIKNTNAVGDNSGDPGGEPHAVMSSMVVMTPVMRSTGECGNSTKTKGDNEKLFHKTSDN